MLKEGSIDIATIRFCMATPYDEAVSNWTRSRLGQHAFTAGRMAYDDLDDGLDWLLSLWGNSAKCWG